VFCQPSGSRRRSGRNQWGGSVTVISMQCFFLAAKWNRGGGSERECWGGSVTVTSISLCVFFCQPSGSRMVWGRDYWGGSVTVTSIWLCVLSAKWKQEGAGRNQWGGSVTVISMQCQGTPPAPSSSGSDPWICCETLQWPLNQRRHIQNSQKGCSHES
jgi:hypothetical protein